MYKRQLIYKADGVQQLMDGISYGTKVTMVVDLGLMLTLLMDMRAVD